MPRRKTTFIENNYYHVYNRGNRKQDIFFQNSDYTRFRSNIFIYSQQTSITVVCYCLMPNHFHLLLKQGSQQKVSLFIKKIEQSHAQYINKRYQLTGSTFQGRFGSRQIESEFDLMNVSKYIHLNPINICKSIEEYEYSSLGEYTGSKKGICEKDEILQHFENKHKPSAYKRFVLSPKITI